MLKLSDIMSGYAAVVVFAGDEVIITWNHSLTLQAWGEVARRDREALEPGHYNTLACRTLESVPTILEACQAAERMYQGHTDSRYDSAYLAFSRVL
jgi:hypothetical protein